jgi:hypothetical protein
MAEDSAIPFRGTLNEADWLAAMRLARQFHHQSDPRNISAFLALVAAGVLVAAFLNRSLVTGAAAVVLGVWSWWIRTADRRLWRANRALHGETWGSVSPEGLEISSSLGTSHYSWQAVHRFVLGPQHALLEMSGGELVPLSARSFADAEGWSRVCALLPAVSSPASKFFTNLPSGSSRGWYLVRQVLIWVTILAMLLLYRFAA